MAKFLEICFTIRKFGNKYLNPNKHLKFRKKKLKNLKQTNLQLKDRLQRFE